MSDIGHFCTASVQLKVEKQPTRGKWCFEFGFFPWKTWDFSNVVVGRQISKCVFERWEQEENLRKEKENTEQWSGIKEVVVGPSESGFESEKDTEGRKQAELIFSKIKNVFEYHPLFVKFIFPSGRPRVLEAFAFFFSLSTPPTHNNPSENKRELRIEMRKKSEAGELFLSFISLDFPKIVSFSFNSSLTYTRALQNAFNFVMTVADVVEMLEMVFSFLCLIFTFIYLCFSSLNWKKKQLYRK